MTEKHTAPLSEHPRIVERSDGYYWLDDELDLEYGPFSTFSDAAQDMQASNDIEYDAEDYESLEEAEAEFGLNWIDPLTGEPGEEGAPRLEDH